MALTNNEQALFVTVSSALIAIGGVSVPLGAPFYFGFGVALAGAAGFGLKEYLGGVPPAGIASAVLSSPQISTVVNLLAAHGYVAPDKAAEASAVISAIATGLNPPA